ncbi:MAG: hypothetical protein KDA32_08410 [Phycisphaerales bacterium]|nr:hypothetical protein [Phycisphaerales bacterium]
MAVGSDGDSMEGERLFGWLKHAFAVEPGEFAPTDQETALVDRLAAAIARRGLSTPALIGLECSHNLNFLASQALVFTQPVAQLIFKPDEYETFARFLDRRGSVEYFCRRLEAAADDLDRSPAPRDEAAAASPIERNVG